MRTPTMIAIGGAIALALAWLLLSRTPPPAPMPTPVASAVVALPPAETPPVETAPAPVAPPAPEPAAANVPPSEAPASTATAAPPPAADETQATTSDDDAETNTNAAADDAAAEEPAADDASSDDDAGPQPIDAEDAADHMADWIASQETEAADDQDKGDHVLATFDDESTDPAWSESTQKQIESVLNQWLDGLPAEIRAHIALFSVECRTTVCQILAADNDIASQSEREKNAQEWQQAIATLPQQSWWHELGFVDLTTTVSSSGATGYALYQTYLLRQATPATG